MITHEDTLEVVHQVTGGLKTGFDIGAEPPDQLKNEDKSIKIDSMKWLLKTDFLSLKIVELNLGKHVRGRNPFHSKEIIPEKFTRKDCAFQVGGAFDPNEFFDPITAGFKVYLKILS